MKIGIRSRIRMLWRDFEYAYHDCNRDVSVAVHFVLVVATLCLTAFLVVKYVAPEGKVHSCPATIQAPVGDK